MTIDRFVDASVLVAIVLREEGWELLDVKLSSFTSVIYSPITVWESVRAVMRETGLAQPDASTEVNLLIGASSATLVPIGARESEAALDAMARYGKGLGHRAALNMGDCFAYACARTHAASLLYKGEDFALTDIDAA